MQHGLLVDNPPGVWSEVDPACLTREILSLVGRLRTHGQQRHPECVTTLAGLSPGVIHLLAKFRVICEDPIVAAARVVYRRVHFLGSLFKDRLGAQRGGDGMREVSIGNTRTGLW